MIKKWIAKIKEYKQEIKIIKQTYGSLTWRNYCKYKTQTPEPVEDEIVRIKKLRYPLGTKVIMRSNEDEPYSVGTIVDYQIMKNSSDPVFFVCELEDGKRVVPWGIVRKYREDLANALNKLTPKEQWLVMANNFFG